MAAYRLPLLPGTKVRRRWPKGEVAYREHNPANTGTVMPYDTTRWDDEPMPISTGCFPVRWRSGFWETCSADDVVVMAEAAGETEAAA